MTEAEIMAALDANDKRLAEKYSGVRKKFRYPRCENCRKRHAPIRFEAINAPKTITLPSGEVVPFPEILRILLEG